MISKIGNMLSWYRTTATLVGMPVLAWILFLAVIGCVSEVSCKVTGRACAYSFTQSADHAIEVLGAEAERSGGEVVRRK
jgi:hypothetical protein